MFRTKTKVDVVTIDVEKSDYEIKMSNGDKFSKTIEGSLYASNWQYDSGVTVNRASEYGEKLTSAYGSYKVNGGQWVNPKFVSSVKLLSTEPFEMKYIRTTRTSIFSTKLFYEVEK